MCGGTQFAADGYGQSRRQVNHNNVSIFDPNIRAWQWGATAPITKLSSLGVRDITHATTKHAIWQGDEWYLFPRPNNDELFVIKYVTTESRWVTMTPLAWPSTATFYECLTVDTIDGFHGILLLGNRRLVTRQRSYVCSSSAIIQCIGIEQFYLYSPLQHTLTRMAWPQPSTPIGLNGIFAIIIDERYLWLCDVHDRLHEAWPCDRGRRPVVGHATKYVMDLKAVTGSMAAKWQARDQYLPTNHFSAPLLVTYSV